MGVLDRLRRSSPENPKTSLSNPSTWLYDALGAAPSRAGVSVSPKNALTLAPVYACVRLISEELASLPLLLYQNSGKGRERAQANPLYALLHDAPNPEMTSFIFRELLQSHLLLWGNAYAEIERDNANRVRALWPLLPDKVEPLYTGYGTARQKIYRVRIKEAAGERDVYLPASSVLHIKGLGFDGLKGYSPIGQLAKETVGLGLAQEGFASSLFANGARPSAIVTVPTELDKDAQERLRLGLDGLMSGLSNANRMAILEEGMKWEKISINPEEAQFLESRRFQVEQIARIFRVPPHMIQDLSHATFSNIEHQNIHFYTNTLRPWLIRWEQELNVSILSAEDRGKLYFEFLLAGALRGDAKTRAEVQNIYRNMGVLSANEIREQENLNPIEGPEGDYYLLPLNMVPASQLLASLDTAEELPDPIPQGEPGAGQRSGLERAPSADSGDSRGSVSPSRETGTLETGLSGGLSASSPTVRQLRSAKARQTTQANYLRLFEQASGRVVRQEVKAAKRMLAQASNLGDFLRDLEKFYESFPEVIKREFLPILYTFAHSLKEHIREETDFKGDIDPQLDVFIHKYAEGIAKRHVANSRGQIESLARKDVTPDVSPEQDIDERLDEWEEKRGGKLAHSESVRSGGAIAKAIYGAIGITAIRWSTAGKNCPLCDELEGKTVGINSYFLDKGASINDPREGAERFTTDHSIGHPPLHQGCDCVITSA